MRICIRIFLAAAIAIALAPPTFAQQKPVPKYGEADKEKTTQEKQAERDAQRAYDDSLKRIPDKGPSDPWGAVRSTEAPKTTGTPAAKPKKTATPQ